LSAEFTIAEIESFQKLIQKPHFNSLYSKIVDYVYPQLRQNPFFGINIKRLKGNLNQYYRYRIGNHRLFYTIDTNKVMVFIITIKDRKDSY
jgi:mRNA interferase RelE/StbE